MKIYTRTGDRGKTSLFSGERTSKAALRVEAYGDVDELNSVLGALASSISDISDKGPSLSRTIQTIQDDLLRIGGWLATTPGSSAVHEIPELDKGATRRLENEIDRMEASLPPIRGFIIPGGHPSACWAHIARAVCRRAERHLVALVEAEEQETGPEYLGRVETYLNRLSDYLFVLARTCNRLHGVPDKHWEP